MTVPNEIDETPRRAAVYRLYDEAGALLYIGSGYDPDVRERAHLHTAWGRHIARRSDEWHGDRQAAYEAEAEAIRFEAPRHNVIGTPNYVGPQQRGEAQRGAADARWRAVRKARAAGASVEEARRAGAVAEIEYLDGTGMFTGWVARMRKAMAEGRTLNQWSMRID